MLEPSCRCLEFDRRHKWCLPRDRQWHDLRNDGKRNRQFRWNRVGSIPLHQRYVVLAKRHVCSAGMFGNDGRAVGWVVLWGNQCDIFWVDNNRHGKFRGHWLRAVQMQQWHMVLAERYVCTGCMHC